MFLLLKKVLSEHWKCHFEYHYPLVRFILDTIACFYDIVFKLLLNYFHHIDVCINLLLLLLSLFSQ